MFTPILIDPALFQSAFKQPTKNNTMLYEVAIIKKATKKEIEEGKPEETLVLAPKTVLAKNREQAIAIAAKEVDNAELANVEFLVRPFA